MEKMINGIGKKSKKPEISLQYEINFPHDVDVGKEERIKKGLYELVVNFFKNKEKRGFNVDLIYNIYKIIYNEYQKELKLSNNFSGYAKTPWINIVKNNRPDFFTEKEWLEFVGKNREKLSDIVKDRK
jgi:hypothetical protein